MAGMPAEKEKQPLDAGLLIVDETSMVDMWLAHQLFTRLTPGTKVLLVGDADQLESVGAGNVFQELIESGIIPVTVLDQIFRQAKGSRIAYNARFINEGNGELCYGPDFSFVPVADQAEAAETVRRLYREEAERVGVQQLQILSPYRKNGETSSQNLNEAIREEINPEADGKPEMIYGGRIFRLRDRVIQLKNNGKMILYNRQGNIIGKGVFNGDVGFVREIRPDTVIIPLLAAHRVLLNRNLLYTAVTRAKGRVILVGQKKALFMAVSRTRKGKRNTLLAERMRLYHSKLTGQSLPAAAIDTPAAQPTPQETDGKQQKSERTHEAPTSDAKQDTTRSAPPPEPEASTDGGQKSAVSTLLQFSHQADSHTVVRPEREDASTGAKAAGDNPPAGAAPNQTTPSYTEDMPVEDICRVMTLEEARAVVVTKGTCKGWSMGKVADQRPSSLRFYLSGFGQCSNIQLAAATLLKQDMELDRAGCPVHFVGSSHARTVYVTEGALKADIAHALTGRTFAAISGANNTNGLDEILAFLRRNGTEEIIEVEDMDKYRNVEVNRGAAAVYRLARKNGMDCRRLNWNPNYKGIDDWQLAVRRKRIETKECNSMNFKEMYLSGMCSMDHMNECAERWHGLPETAGTLRECLGLSEREMDVCLQIDQSTTLEQLLDSQRRCQHSRLY